MPVHRSALHKIARVPLSFAAVSFTASSIYPLIRPLSFFMSSQRLLCILSSHYSSSYPARLTTRSLFFIRFPAACTVIQLRYHRFASWISSSAMPNYQRKGGQREQRWIEKPKSDRAASSVEGSSAPVAEASTSRLGGLSISDNCCQEHGRIPPVQFGSIEVPSQITAQSQKAIWKPKCIGTVNGSVKPESRPVDKAAAEIKRNGAGNSVFGKSGNEPSKELMDSLLADFSVDNSTYSRAEIRATFYPKFENEKSDQEVRARMIEMVSKGIAALEVTLKHSGSLFMYAGHQGGAYAKNSYGNIYTAVGVFVLARTFCKAWGTQAAVKQAEFNEFLEENRMCISMELVTAVLGDHGQRPHEDYVVITAVTELGYGRPNFYSTADVITFCRKWRLPTNHVWLFSTRKSVTSFFAAYDALCEEGTATPICRSLDDVADISVPGSIDHIKVQGEILEGLVARIVSHESSEHMEKILRDFSPPPSDGAALDLGPSLREVCAANRSNEKQQIKSVLKNVGPSFCPNYIDWFGNDAGDINSGNADQSDQKKRSVDRSVLTKFLQAHPVDHSTVKLQEMARLIREKHYRTDFKCYYNFHKINSFSRSNLYFKMVIHVRSDSAFRRYQKEMRFKPGLWPLYRGFFVDINLFKENKEKAAEMARHFNSVVESVNGSNGPSENDLADEDANLMIKLKFLTYKLRTFLIRNGLSILFTDGPAAYKAYYMRQMNIWNTSAVKQRGLSKMLDEWANYIRRKCGSNKLSSSTYLSEAEPFLEQYAKRSQENQALIGSAGNFVRAEDFMAIVEAGRDEEGDLQTEWEVASSSRSPLVKDPILKDEGLIVFFPGIPGCAKSALCKELLSSRGVFGDDKCVHSLMGDLVKGRYWQKVADEYKRKPSSVLLADKNAPNEEVWRQIEDMCRTARAHAVPIVPDSEGTYSNPFSHDALAVFIFRVLQRVNHPGNLDKASPNVGYVLLMFYHLYEGKNRKEFEGELIERFGSLVKMPLLKFDRRPLPAPMNSTLEEGINLYRLHTSRHGRLDSTKGSYAKDWSKWEKQLRKVLFDNAEYLSSIQVPFEFAVTQVLEQLQTIAKGGYTTPSTEKRKFGSIVFAAVSLPVAEIKSLLENVAQMNSEVEAFVKNKNLETLQKAHVTLAHKRSHGVTAVANYGQFLHHQVNVAVTALLFSEKVAAAFEVCLGSVDGGGIISSRNEWPHVTLWTAEGVAPKEANALPNLTREGKAARVIIDPPVSISGPLEFF